MASCAGKDHGTPHRGKSESTARSLELDKEAYPKQKASTRDNFSDYTKQAMAYRVGGLCSMCGCKTYGPLHDNDKNYVTIGEAAHIFPASGQGPRRDSSMSSDQASNILNGIWVCSNCHTKIDRDEKAYSVEYLQCLKKVAEKRANINLFLARETHILSLSKVVSTLVEEDIQQCMDNTDMQPLEKLMANLDYVNFEDSYYQQSVAKKMLEFIERNIIAGHHPSTYDKMLMHLKRIIKVHKTLNTKALKLEAQLTKLAEEELPHLLSNVHIDTDT